MKYIIPLIACFTIGCYGVEPNLVTPITAGTINHSDELTAIQQSGNSCTVASIWQALQLACLNINGKSNYPSEDLYWTILRGFEPSAGGSNPNLLLPIFKGLQPTIQSKRLSSVEDVKYSISLNHPVVVGMIMTDEFMSWGVDVNQFDNLDKSKIFELPTNAVNHFVLVTGFDNDTKSFTILNSYSDKWGNKGRAKISMTSVVSAYEIFLNTTDNNYCQPTEKTVVPTTIIYR